jgi:hypothetical protein
MKLGNEPLLIRIFVTFAFLIRITMKRYSLSFNILIILFFLSGTVGGQIINAGSPAADSGLITFRVDMSQWAAEGRFHPSTDSLDMSGTMNNWNGSVLLQKVDTTLVYQIVLKLNAATVQEFRFRINRDTNNAELTSHMYRVPNDTTSVTFMYNDYDTTTVPITFRCHMLYQISSFRFNPLPQHDYLDVGGTFNGNGAYDLLFDRANDSIYELTLNLPRILISSVTPLAFKFRMNGDWTTSEFQTSGNYRTYFLQDTTGGVRNLVDVWYDDINPAIPACPIASNVYIQGKYAAGQILSGAYSYEDYNLRPEGNSLYRWYIADSTTQVSLTPIGDSTINYVVDSLNAGKYIAFEVTPVASGTGDSLTGKPVMVWTGMIGGVGISHPETDPVHLYPNPATTEVILDGLGNIRQIEIYNFAGMKTGSFPAGNATKIIYQVQGLSSGIYFLKFFRNDGRFTTRKLVKY